MEMIVSVVLLFLGIGVLLLIRVFIIGRTLRNGGGIVVERGAVGSTSMSQEDVDKLPCFDFVGEEKSRKTVSPDCAVCLEEFRAGEKCRLLPLCNHRFHAECVDSWLLRTSICPICRTGVDPAKSVSVSGEDRGDESGDCSHASNQIAAIGDEDRDSHEEEDSKLQGISRTRTSTSGDQNRLAGTVVVRIDDY